MGKKKLGAGEQIRSSRRSNTSKNIAEQTERIQSVFGQKMTSTKNSNQKESVIKVEPTTVNTKQDVIEVIRNNLDNFAKFGVSQVAIFGSFVRNANAFSVHAPLCLCADHKASADDALVDFSVQLIVFYCQLNRKA